MVALSSLTRPPFSKVSQRKVAAYIVPLKANGEPETGDALRFQYFPESVSDTKAVNWAPREIPGASLPIYNWISSGERTISFTAVFTTDVDLVVAEKNKGFGTSDIATRLKNIKAEDRNVDIRAAVLWLRAFMLPTYDTEGPLGVPAATAPPRLLLVFPKSGMGTAGGAYITGNVPDELQCVMTQCDVNYEAWFPSGLPRVATVSLAFAQVAQNPSGAVTFPAGGIHMWYEREGSPGPEKSFGYKLAPDVLKK